MVKRVPGGKAEGVGKILPVIDHPAPGYPANQDCLRIVGESADFLPFLAVSEGQSRLIPAIKAPVGSPGLEAMLQHDRIEGHVSGGGELDIGKLF